MCGNIYGILTFEQLKVQASIEPLLLLVKEAGKFLIGKPVLLTPEPTASVPDEKLL